MVQALDRIQPGSLPASLESASRQDHRLRLKGPVRHHFARYQRRGLTDFSRATTPFASKSSCTHFIHHPAFAPPGYSDSGRCAITAVRIADCVRPGAFLGNALKSAAFIALYLFASTVNVRPGDKTFSTRTRSGLGAFGDDMGLFIFKRLSITRWSASQTFKAI